MTTSVGVWAYWHDLAGFSTTAGLAEAVGQRPTIQCSETAGARGATQSSIGKALWGLAYMTCFRVSREMFPPQTITATFLPI